MMLIKRFGVQYYSRGKFNLDDYLIIKNWINICKDAIGDQSYQEVFKLDIDNKEQFHY